MSDSDSEETNLTREQKEFLDECLVEFANRFSEDDATYTRIFELGIPKPPIINPWYGRPRLTASRMGNRNHQGRHDRNRYNNRDSSSRYDRDRQNDDGKPRHRYTPY